VDNGSGDDSADVILDECAGVNLIRNVTNLGFAGGNNQGIKCALSVSDAPIFLLNNDASITEQDALRLARTLQENERLGFVGPLLYDADEEGKLLSSGGRDIGRHVDTHRREIAGGSPLLEADYVPGTAVLIRAEVFRTVGLFDEAYFFSGEIADLCERAKQQGYLSVIDTRARAYHSVSHTSDSQEALRAYYSVRNRFLFIGKFRRSQRLWLFGFWIVYGLLASLKAGLSGKRAKARAVRLALVDGLRGRLGGQNERVLPTGLS
jgi:GT2 family glycosyltransferase